MCWRRCGRCGIPAPRSSSRRTNATRTGSGFMGIGRKTRWGARSLQRQQGRRRTGHQLLSALILPAASGEDCQRARGQCHRRRGLGRGPHCAGLHAGAGRRKQPIAGAQSEGHPALAACAGAAKRVSLAGACLAGAQRTGRDGRQKTEDRGRKSEVRAESNLGPIHDQLVHYQLAWTPLSTSGRGMSRTGRWRNW